MRRVCGPPGTQRYSWPGPLGICHQLSKDAVDRVRVQERHFEAEQAPTRLVVHELVSFRRQLVDRGAHVVYLVGDVVHTRPALGQELADRRLLAQGGQELDVLLADVEPESRSSETVGTVKAVSLPEQSSA